MAEYLWGKPVDPADGWSADSGLPVVEWIAGVSRERAGRAFYCPEAFRTIYLDEIGYPGWVGEGVPDVHLG